MSERASATAWAELLQIDPSEFSNLLLTESPSTFYMSTQANSTCKLLKAILSETEALAEDRRSTATPRLPLQGSHFSTT